MSLVDRTYPDVVAPFNAVIRDRRTYDGYTVENVSIDNYDRMEVGQPHTVTLQGDAASGYYADSEVSEGEPVITVYACPEDVNGPTGQSGNAQEVTVIREQAPNGSDTFTFQAEADNARQELFLDGWFRVDSMDSSSF